MTSSELELFGFLKELMLTFLDVEEDKITPETALADLNMVSLDFVETQVAIQKTYGIKIDVGSLVEQGIVTVGDFVRHVELARCGTGASDEVAMLEGATT